MDMKEKYETLSLAVLKDVAKARGLKGTSALKKSDLIERLLEEDRKTQKTEETEPVRENRHDHESWKYSRTDTDLSAVRTIFRERMMFMFPRPRSGNSDSRQGISFPEIRESRHSLKNSVRCYL